MAIGLVFLIILIFPVSKGRLFWGDERLLPIGDADSRSRRIKLSRFGFASPRSPDYIALLPSKNAKSDLAKSSRDIGEHGLHFSRGQRDSHTPRLPSRGEALLEE